MARSLYIDKISHRVLFLGGVVYILNYLFDGLLSKYLALNPEAVLQNWELWRLVTFPFSAYSLEGILLFGFTFLIVGPKVEQYIGRYIYPFVLSLLVLLEGILLTLSFWKENVAIGGMEGLSFFVLTLYSLLYFGKRSDFSNYRPTKARMIVSLVAFAWASVLLTRSLLTANMEYLITNSASAMIGLFSGILLYIQLRMLKKSGNA
jgi:membrane associated rhomboid family serine protease